LEIVTVALDTGGETAAGPWIEAAKPEHPSLIDQAHLLDELFGITNVPTGVWIDEAGMIVRPPEPAFPLNRGMEKILRTLPEGLDPYLVEVLLEARRIRHEPEKYVTALRDWAERGSESRFALSAQEVTARSGTRSLEVATAAAHFELGQHLYRMGENAGAVEHFKEAHRMQPDNWTYKRQAWSFANPLQGPSEDYEGDWLSEVREIGAENYYPALDM
jgi:tetratricopeptide (TPR) repeat protein